MVPIDCKLFRPDVLESTWSLPFLKIALLLNEHSQARRESVNLAAGAVLSLRTIADSTSHDFGSTTAEFTRTTSIPIHTWPVRTGSVDKILV